MEKPKSLQLKERLTIAQMWDVFRNIVLVPINAPEVQVLEMKKAFYAGATSFFDVMMANGNLPDAEAEAELGKLSNEMQSFAMSLVADNPNIRFKWKQ